MQKSEYEKIITGINKLIRQKYTSFKGLFFYGSRIKNTNAPDADYDIVLTFDKKPNWRLKNTIYGLISDYEVKNDIIIDVHVYKLDDILNPITPFRNNVKNEGIFYGV